jgi:hypothetical protein
LGKRPFASCNLVDQFVLRALRRIIGRTSCYRRVCLESGCQFGVDFRVFWVLISAFHNRADRAGGITTGTFRAFLGVDNHERLALVIARVNTIHRAYIDALRVNFTQALLSNDIRHDSPPWIFALLLGRGLRLTNAKRR